MDSVWGRWYLSPTSIDTTNKPFVRIIMNRKSVKKVYSLIDFPKYPAQSTADRDSQLSGMDCGCPEIPLILLMGGSVAVTVKVGVGVAKKVGDAVGVGVKGEGGKGV